MPVKQAFSDLRHQVQKVKPLNGEGSICASVRKMSVNEATQCAVSVVTMYGEVSRLGEIEQATLPFEDKDRTVPPFLVKSN